MNISSTTDDHAGDLLCDDLHHPRPLLTLSDPNNAPEGDKRPSSVVDKNEVGPVSLRSSGAGKDRALTGGRTLRQNRP